MMTDRQFAASDKPPLHAPLFLYGPPGSGKSALGKALAQALNLPFCDLDEEIEARTGQSIAQIFSQQGEEAFRRLEREMLEKYLERKERVVALGGGALLDPGSRLRVEASGRVICLRASLTLLLERLRSEAERRPLLAGELYNQLADILAKREGHYASFSIQLDVDGKSPGDLAWQAQVLLGRYHLRGMASGLFPGCEVRVQAGSLVEVGECLRIDGLGGPVAVVSDANVARLYAPQVMKSLEETGYAASLVEIPAGEEQKNLRTVERLWASFLTVGLDRAGTVVALGGGVVGDLAGFAAAIYLRGVGWVSVPTTLLSMVDASLGGKTGVDLPQGKNLVGSFHPPRLVLADPDTLESLPPEELRSGMAEAIKHGLIADPELFSRCAQGWDAVAADWDWLVRRAMAVKIQIIEADPYERGRRAALNLGHTLGHAIERASDYRLRHGEAVAIGMLAAARLAVRLEMAPAELASRLEAVLRGLGLPRRIPENLDRDKILEYMGVDKKRAGGKPRFVLPVGVGEVRDGIEVDDPALIFEEVT
ncbi:MAG TPA: 3-dehydroquinate synthase [Anaerolineales bacterium]|nr:3-dehydroquinate synthase [Anaerolineales bacterium]